MDASMTLKEKLTELIRDRLNYASGIKTEELFQTTAEMTVENIFMFFNQDGYKKMTNTWCAYCGKDFPLDTVTADQVGEHINTCEKHPLYQANERIAELEKMNEEMKQDNTVMAEHNVEMESNLEAMRTNQCSMCTLWQKMKTEGRAL